MFVFYTGGKCKENSGKLGSTRMAQFSLFLQFTILKWSFNIVLYLQFGSLLIYLFNYYFYFPSIMIITDLLHCFPFRNNTKTYLISRYSLKYRYLEKQSQSVNKKVCSYTFIYIFKKFTFFQWQLYIHLLEKISLK